MLEKRRKKWRLVKKRMRKTASRFADKDYRMWLVRTWFKYQREGGQQMKLKNPAAIKCSAPPSLPPEADAAELRKLHLTAETEMQPTQLELRNEFEMGRMGIREYLATCQQFSYKVNNVTCAGGDALNGLTAPHPKRPAVAAVKLTGYNRQAWPLCVDCLKQAREFNRVVE